MITTAIETAAILLFLALAAGGPILYALGATDEADRPTGEEPTDQETAP